MQRCEGDRHRHHPNAAMRPNLRDNDDDQDTKQLAEQTLLARYEILNLRDSDKWVTLYIEKAKSKQCIFFPTQSIVKQEGFTVPRLLRLDQVDMKDPGLSLIVCLLFVLFFIAMKLCYVLDTKERKKKPESEPHEDVSASITA